LSVISIIVSLLVDGSNAFQSIAPGGGRRSPAAGPQDGRSRGAGRDPLGLLGVPSAEEIKQRIEAAIPGSRAAVEDYTGGGDHFRATVTAPAFEGLSRIDQHRLVYGVFGDEVGGAIHALALRTQAPADAPAETPTT
jgi:stress-induced morphogen